MCFSRVRITYKRVDSIHRIIYARYNTRGSENEKACKEKMKQSSCRCARVTGVVVRLIASDRGGVLHTWSIRRDRSSEKRKKNEREREGEEKKIEDERRKAGRYKKLEATRCGRRKLFPCSILSPCVFSLIYDGSRNAILIIVRHWTRYVVETNFFLRTMSAKCPSSKFSPECERPPTFIFHGYVWVFEYIDVHTYYYRNTHA